MGTDPRGGPRVDVFVSVRVVEREEEPPISQPSREGEVRCLDIDTQNAVCLFLGGF